MTESAPQHRVAWCVNGIHGFSQPYECSAENLERLRAVVKEACEAYGPNSHWVELIEYTRIT